MSEKNTTPEFETNEETLPLPETADTPAMPDGPEAAEDAPIQERRGYRNPTARLMNGFFFACLAFTVAYLGFQIYLSVTSYIAQQAPMSIAVLYTFASILMPLILLFALSFVFKFFAEVVELMDRRNRMRIAYRPTKKSSRI